MTDRRQTDRPRHRETCRSRRNHLHLKTQFRLIGLTNCSDKIGFVQTGGGPVAEKLREFYAQTSRPLLKDVRFRYDSRQVDNTTLTEQDFSAHYEPSELIVVGRLQPRASHLSVKVSGASKQVNSTRIAYPGS